MYTKQMYICARISLGWETDTTEMYIYIYMHFILSGGNILPAESERRPRTKYCYCIYIARQGNTPSWLRVGKSPCMREQVRLVGRRLVTMFVHGMRRYTYICICVSP